MNPCHKDVADSEGLKSNAMMRRQYTAIIKKPQGLRVLCLYQTETCLQMPTCMHAAGLCLLIPH